MFFVYHSTSMNDSNPLRCKIAIWLDSKEFIDFNPKKQFSLNSTSLMSNSEEEA